MAQIPRSRLVKGPYINQYVGTAPSIFQLLQICQYIYIYTHIINIDPGEEITGSVAFSQGNQSGSSTSKPGTVSSTGGVGQDPNGGVGEVCIPERNLLKNVVEGFWWYF